MGNNPSLVVRGGLGGMDAVGDIGIEVIAELTLDIGILHVSDVHHVDIVCLIARHKDQVL